MCGGWGAGRKKEAYVELHISVHKKACLVTSKNLNRINVKRANALKEITSQTD